MIVLVDTSVLSLALRRRRPERRSSAEQAIVEQLNTLAEDDQAAIIGMVRQELLSGVRTEKQFEELKEVLEGFLYISVTVDDHDKAAQFLNQCRSQGVAATDVDMLICAAAAQRGIPVLTTDGDFDRYARCIPFDRLPLPK